MAIRKVPLTTGQMYHLIARSTHKQVVFTSDYEYNRTLRALWYFQHKKPLLRFAKYLALPAGDQHAYTQELFHRPDRLIRIIAYCIMPTHIHLLVHQDADAGISTFMRNLLNSHAHYFNRRYTHAGGVWINPFKSVHIESDTHLFTETCYIHLNPVKAFLVERPEHWHASSYTEYLLPPDAPRAFSIKTDPLNICTHKDFLHIDPAAYEKFIIDSIPTHRARATAHRTADALRASKNIRDTI